MIWVQVHPTIFAHICLLCVGGHGYGFFVVVQIEVYSVTVVLLNNICGIVYTVYLNGKLVVYRQSQLTS